MKLRQPTRTARATGLLVFVMIASPLAAAKDSGWYLGGNLGLSHARIDDKRITSGLQGMGYTTTSIDEDERDLGYKLFGGYQFNRFLALEGGYFDLGEFGYVADVQPPGTLSGDVEIKGFNLDLIGFLPITEKFSAFGRGGVNYAKAKAHFAGTGSVNVPDPDQSEHGADYKFGLGLQYFFTQSFGMRAEAERYRIDDAVGNNGDVDLYSAGVVYRFGAEAPRPTPVPVATPAPPPVVAASPPPPPPPAPSAPKRMSFSADSLFDFDRAIIKPAGRQDLDKFAADLNGMSYDVITVTGHTDRIGAQSYNLELSRRRAEAVRDYLVSTGIPAARISARGVNGSEPVTKAGDCTGREKPTASKELVACLQPDRRVEVEVSGTR